jgi:hypothetical protein
MLTVKNDTYLPSTLVRTQVSLVRSMRRKGKLCPTVMFECGVYKYISNSSNSSLLPICSPKEILWSVKESKSLRLVLVKWEFMLVTLSNRHHLDGSVVIESLVIIRRSLWMTQVMVWAVEGDSPWRSIKESAHREHLIPAQIKGELHPCAGAPTRTSGEWWLSNTSKNIAAFLSLSIYFGHLHLSNSIYVFTFLEFSC